MSSPNTHQLKPVQIPYEEFEKLAKRVAEVRYPTPHSWDVDTMKRHIHHLVIAYQLRPDLFVEDALSLLPADGRFF